ncbi:MAG TPA: hypothetical protein VE934_15185 [Polaromonas sp.]|uniref:hypothetical protein n=1 Tax=Polaromonas sp. TaxID=1869339 RepID=UPI002D69C0AA|nr:hypothetical protein [Polaromonas sp.]HYW58298.1 hypothetical protein [Polaromonas sp.]
MTSFKYLIVLFSAFITLGCASMGSAPMGNDSTVTEANSKQISGDIPLPVGAVIKQQDTLVMGSGSAWTGRLSVAISGEPQAVFAYFRDTLPASGWALTSSSFSKTSLLSFTKGERAATVQVQSTSFGGNDVLITVAPAIRPAAGRP